MGIMQRAFLIALSLVSITVGCGRCGTQSAASAARAGSARTVVYHNRQYRFRFALPSDWAGFTVDASRWEGNREDAEGQNESGEIWKIGQSNPLHAY